MVASNGFYPATRTNQTEKKTGLPCLMEAIILIQKDFLPVSYLSPPQVSVNLSAFRLQTACGSGVSPPWKIRDASITRWFCCGKAAFCLFTLSERQSFCIYCVLFSNKSILTCTPITRKKIHLQLVPTMNSSFRSSKVFRATAYRRILEHLPYKNDSVQIQSVSEQSSNLAFNVKFQCYLIAS